MKLRDVPEINPLEFINVVCKDGKYRDSEPCIYLGTGKDEFGDFIEVARGIKRGREYGVQRVYLGRVDKIKMLVESDS